jgi:hypothetical protein
MSKLITEQQVAEHFGFPKSLVRKLRVEGKLPHVHLGYRSIRYDMSAVIAAMKRLEVRPVQ